MWVVEEAGANPQTSLVSETLFPTSLRSSGVTAVKPPFLLFPEINTFARPYSRRYGRLASNPFSGRKNSAVDFTPI